MSDQFDVIVLGLGGMGSAAACHVASRGRRVLGLEQFTSPHDHGSSHGESRVIRQAYYESPAYVPLLIRAYELWKKLEHETGSRLLNLCGGLMMGSPSSEVVTGSQRSAIEHRLPVELLDAKQIHQRFPALHPPPETMALFEKNAGYILPELSVKAHLTRAKELGADLHFQETVLGWEPASDGVRVTTARGSYQARRLIVAAGPWAERFLGDLHLPLEVERQVLYWFQPKTGIEMFRPGNFPIFILDAGGGLLPYGFPAIGRPEDGVKISLYRCPRRSICTPETIQRAIDPEEVDFMRSVFRTVIPPLDGPFLKGVTCMYTLTPDKNFIIDLHPEFPQISIAAGFSGHGFKFCSVVGEILADLSERGATAFDLSPFRLQRFTAPSPPKLGGR